jgi:ribonuclease VapC
MTKAATTYVVDTSALIACCLAEPGYQAIEKALSHADRLVMSAVTHLELGMVAMTRKVQIEAQQMVQLLQIEVLAFDADLSHVALAAFEQFGKGRHPAGLNFGDCCAYAQAKSMQAPLVFKGQDFAQTDIMSALA